MVRSGGGKGDLTELEGGPGSCRRSKLNPLRTKCQCEMVMSVFVTPPANEPIVAKLPSSTRSDGELEN